MVVEEPPPPQPTIVAVEASTTNPTQAVIHAPRRVSFLRRKMSGKRRKGSRMFAEVVLVTVSLKTAVT